MGVTVCAASGDHGTADLDAQHWEQDKRINVNHPAVNDFVLGCGGTQITQGKDVVWNDGTPFDVTVRGGGGWATGGGISVVFPVPSYQTGASFASVNRHWQSWSWCARHCYERDELLHACGLF